MRNITTLEELKEVVQGNPKVIVKAGLSYCAPCKQVQPTFERYILVGDIIDGWENVEYYRYIGSHLDNESPRNRLGGYVYILTNGAYPNKCKIGMTTSSPEKRLQQINSAGVVNDWGIAYTFKCARPYDFEQAIHVVLDDVRSRSDREFFDIDLNDAIGLIIDMGDEYSPLD